LVLVSLAALKSFNFARPRRISRMSIFDAQGGLILVTAGAETP
jgi:hypothetical protein